MEADPFDNGAMRNCFRGKKPDSRNRTEPWAKASNVVFKRNEFGIQSIISRPSNSSSRSNKPLILARFLKFLSR